VTGIGTHDQHAKERMRLHFLDLWIVWQFSAGCHGPTLPASSPRKRWRENEDVLG
jgi:hypothetical protein